MNVPGQAEGNWTWRLWPGQIKEAMGKRLHGLTDLYGRLCVAPEDE